jgi:hypothetical protein
MSCVKYTFTRCPSRMVIVGGIWRNWSRTVVAELETLPAAPVVKACGPLVEMVPPPCWISAVPAIRPSAIDVPNICR